MACYSMLKYKESIDLSLKSKKMIDELKPDEKKEIYQYHQRGKIRHLMMYL